MTLEPSRYADLVDAVFGDRHSDAFPDTWMLGWEDENGDEITGTGYVRMPVANTSAVWAWDDTVLVNQVPLDGGTPTGTDWPDIHALILCDPSGGGVIFRAILAEPVVPVEGTPVAVLAGAVTVSVDA